MSDLDLNFRLAQFIDIDPLMELVQEFYQFEKITFDDGVIKAFIALLSDEQFGVIWLMCDRDRTIGWLCSSNFLF
jgi:hypothetical protein